MNIAIVGAGVAGITTAHALARDGHAVTVYEQRSSAAEGASFAPTGWLAPALLHPWSAPGLLRNQSLLRIAGAPAVADLRWLWSWRQASKRIRSQPERPHPALAAIERLAQYSRQLRESTYTDQDLQRQAGAMVLLRTEASLAQLQPALTVLADADIAVQQLNAAQARQLEPGLSSQQPLFAALNLPTAETANCRLWAQQQRLAAQQLGVQFVFSARVSRLHQQPTGLQLAGESGMRAHDAIAVCTGGASAELLQPLGLKLPLIGLGGYTVSAPLRDHALAPRCAIVDWESQISLVRLGQRVRVGGGAEIGRSAQQHAPSLQRLYQALSDWFPGGMQASQGVQVWRGSRAMSPDGAPLLGACGLPGIWLNLGHGNNGAAMAHGAAQLLADLIAQRPPGLDTTGLSLQRF